MTASAVVRWLSMVAIGLLLALGPTARAQLLAELQLVAATSLTLNPAVSLPAGSYRAVGAGAEALLARVPDASRWTDWEVYAASGVAASLQPAFVANVVNSFAAAGYFAEESGETRLGNEVHSRTVFLGEDGSRALLYSIRTAGELVWLVARER